MSVKRLERFWHNLVVSSSGTDVDGAVVVCYPEVPIYPVNHATDINVNEDEAQGLLDRVAKYFLSRGSSYACFRISPLTHPKWFTLLEENGFERKSEQSVMVFKVKPVEDKMNPDVKVKEISESEIDSYNKLLMRSFEMPNGWKEGLDKLIRRFIQKGWKCYLAYVDGKPVGTSALFSVMNTGGIFNVGTLKEYRGRGIGTTLTVHAVVDSIDEGNTLHTLQAEKGGDAERLYKKIGFVVDHTISYFVKKFQGTN